MQVHRAAWEDEDYRKIAERIQVCSQNTWGCKEGSKMEKKRKYMRVDWMPIVQLV
jgi:hypothetical protein